MLTTYRSVISMATSVEKSRFKTFPVKNKHTIKNLVELNRLPFKKGRGFYQLSKPELIQDYKEVIIRKKEDKGAIITGDKVREVLGIPKSSKKFKIDLTEIPDFDVFVQSTSVNRILLPDTDFLYETDESTDTAVVSLHLILVLVLSMFYQIIFSISLLYSQSILVS